MFKKGEMGVGTLIVFIAMILVAAIAASVLIQTTSSLQEKALTTGTQAEASVSTYIEIIEISATDGTDAALNNFTQIMKLAAGSDAINLDQTILTMTTTNKTASLKYRGPSGDLTLNNSGFNTFNSAIT